MRVIEREHQGYEILEVPYGKVYSWNPGRIRLECDCGAVLELDEPIAECECGARHEVGLNGSESLQKTSGKPWLEDYAEWREEKLANGVTCEYYAFMEVSNDS